MTWGAIRYALPRRRGRAPWQASPASPARPTAAAWPPAHGSRRLRPACRPRQLALERSHHAQYRSDRLCPVVAGDLRQIRQGSLTA